MTRKTEEKKYGIVVAVPSSREGIGIINMIESVAIQKGIDLMEVAFTCVINNQSDADSTILESNRMTADLIRGIMEKKVPEVIREIQNEDAKRKTLRQFGRITRSGLDVGMVDKWTEGNAEVVNNVGVAREIARQRALELVREDGFVTFSDADSTLDKNYLHNAGKEFRENNSVHALTGSVFIDLEEDLSFEEKKATEAYFLSQKIVELYKKFSFVGIGTERARLKQKYLMSGSNMTVSADALSKVSFPPIAGAEDGQLSKDLLRLGYNIRHLGALTVYTSARFSDRTSEDHGLGFALIKRAVPSGNYSSASVTSLDYNKEREGILHVLNVSRLLESFDSEIMKKDILRYSSVTSEEANRIVKEFLELPAVPAEENWILCNIIDTILKNYYPASNFKTELDGLQSRLCDSTTIGLVPHLVSYFGEMNPIMTMHTGGDLVQQSKLSLYETQHRIRVIDRGIDIVHISHQVQHAMDDLETFLKREEPLKSPSLENEVVVASLELRDAFPDVVYISLRLAAAKNRLKELQSLVDEDFCTTEMLNEHLLRLQNELESVGSSINALIRVSGMIESLKVTLVARAHMANHSLPGFLWHDDWVHKLRSGSVVSLLFAKMEFDDLMGHI